MAGGRLVAGPGPMRPEVPQVGAHSVRLAVDQLGGQLHVVKALVPELPLGLRGEDPVPDSGSGGAMTRARTRSGRSLAMAWAILLPMSYPPMTGRPSASSSISPMTLRAWAAASYWAAGSAWCLSDSPNPRRSGTITSAAADTSGATTR